MEVAPPQKLLTVLLLLFLFTLAYAYINWWLQHFGNIAILLYRLRSKKRDRGYGVETPKDCYDYWSTYGAKTFKLINIQNSSIKLESKFHQVTAILLSLEREFEHCQRGLEDLGGDDRVGRGIRW